MPTHIVRLAEAPFPTSHPGFFDHSDPVTGEPARQASTGVSYRRSPHYTDDRVLLHWPDHAGRPDAVLLFFHGHMGEIARDVASRWLIPDQVDAAGSATLLIAPQLARDALDSHPGKLDRPDGAANLIAACGNVIASVLDGPQTDLNRAPIVLTAFSAGWRALTARLERGGIADRVAAVVLLDALFGGIETLAGWSRRGPLISLSGPRCDTGRAALEERLTSAGRSWQAHLPRHVTPVDIVLAGTRADHLYVPLAGPPSHPVAAVLRTLHPYLI